MNQMTFPISWVEIPALDIHRARDFYAALLDRDDLEVTEDGEMPIVLLDAEANGQRAGGSINQVEGFVPSEDGPLPYLNVQSIEQALTRVQSAGGKVVTEKAPLGQAGFFATICDSEGNKMALFAMA